MKKGFTLAEVLITLAVIGVVAALTIPVLVQKYQKKQYYTSFMKLFNTFTNAVELSVSENGPISSMLSSNVSPNDFAENYIAPYLKVVATKDVPDYMVKTLSGNDLDTLNGLSVSNAPENSDKYYILADGSAINLMVKSGSHWVIFLADTNGVKGPNIIGRDIFAIMISDYDDYGNGKQADDQYFITAQVATGDNNEACSVDGNGGTFGIPGLGCADRLLKEGAMN